jgi:hypothetical protein
MRVEGVVEDYPQPWCDRLPFMRVFIPLKGLKSLFISEPGSSRTWPDAAILNWNYLWHWVMHQYQEIDLFVCRLVAFQEVINDCTVWTNGSSWELEQCALRQGYVTRERDSKIAIKNAYLRDLLICAQPCLVLGYTSICYSGDCVSLLLCDNKCHELYLNDLAAEAPAQSSTAQVRVLNNRLGYHPNQFPRASLHRIAEVGSCPTWLRARLACRLLRRHGTGKEFQFRQLGCGRLLPLSAASAIRCFRVKLLML